VSDITIGMGGTADTPDPRPVKYGDAVGEVCPTCRQLVVADPRPVSPPSELTAEDRVVLRMREAVMSPDLKDAVPGSVLEHVYDKVISWLLTEAENIRKRAALAASSPATAGREE